jgi:hypothetical protein
MTTLARVSAPFARPGDRYIGLLSFALAGYAIVGKGFAYIGYPPLFIGEVVLATGVVVLLRSGGLLASITMIPNLFLAAAMVWVALRTVPYVGVYGVDALRDSVVVIYGIFAFVMIALVLEDARRLRGLLQNYATFIRFFVPAMPLIYGLNRYWSAIPSWPVTNVPIMQVRSGEVAVHLAGAAAFALAGFVKTGRLWVICYIVSAIMVAASSRAAMLAIVVPILIAVIIKGYLRNFVIYGAAGLFLFGAAYAIESTLTEYHEPGSSSERAVSTLQIADNIASIAGRSSDQNESTKAWREDWWAIIFQDTLYGPHFWTGRGFGLNLATADGFQDGDHPDRPALRSPHNVQMTMLARAGVPGLALWILTLVSWATMMSAALLRARRRGHKKWESLFLFLTLYVAAAEINGSFDVALEGPMQGIWFWCLIGLGTGSVMVYRCRPDVL